MTSDPGKLRRFADDYTAAWCSMDPVRVAAHYAPDGSLAINGGTPAVGRAAIAQTARGFYAALPDMQVYLDELIVDGVVAAKVARAGLVGGSSGGWHMLTKNEPFDPGRPHARALVA